MWYIKSCFDKQAAIDIRKHIPNVPEVQKAGQPIE